MHIQTQALTAQAFGPYGRVMDAGAGSTSRSINQGSSRRVDLPDQLDLQRHNGQPVVAVFCAQARPLHGPWTELEQHRLGSQSFIPLGGARCVVLVALGNDAPAPSTLAAFEVHGQQGFTLNPGTWHHGLIALDSGHFVVIERGGSEVDCDIAQLAEPVVLLQGDA